MNILILAKHRSLGGLIKHIGLLGKGLTEYEGDTIVVGISPGEGAKELSKSLNVDLLPFSLTNPLKMIKTYRGLGRLVNKYAIDVIHTENRVPSLFAAFYCLFHKNVKYLWSNHQVPIPSDFVHRAMTKYGELAVAEGIEGRRLLINELRIPEEKTTIVNLGIELEKFVKTDEKTQSDLKTKIGVESGTKVLMLYGRLAESKGHLFLLDALNKVIFKNYRLVMPGDDASFKETVIARAKEYGIADKLVFPGFVNGRDYLSISDLMLLPSKNEGFPQACVEAYAMGVPVIRTKTGGYEDTKDMCWGVDFGDVDTLAKLLNDYFADDKPFAEKAKHAEEAVKRLSVEAMAHNYQIIYQDILKK